MNRTTGIVVSVALAAVAVIVAAYFFTHKPKPEAPDSLEKRSQQTHEAEVACLEGGGTWVPGFLAGTCEHSSVETAAPPVEAAPTVEAPSTSDSDPNESVNEAFAEGIVDNNFNQAEIARFCFAVEQAGYDAALRAFKTAYDMPQGISPQSVFREIVSRCP